MQPACPLLTACPQRALPHHPQEQVEPLMMQYKPPGLIKKIYFQKLTFGDDPFRHALLGHAAQGPRRARHGGRLCAAQRNACRLCVGPVATASRCSATHTGHPL